MPALLPRRRFLGLATVHALACAAGCGTVLHPERRGQPAGRLDWGIVALDAVGLLFFFVPGVIAFAVDFSNGTIYLPPDRYSGNEKTSGGRSGRSLVRVDVPPRELTSTRIERVVSAHAGWPLRLSTERLRSRPLHDLDEFWSVHDEYADA